MKNGDIVALECQGSIPGPRWLEGNPADSMVRLVEEPTAGDKSCYWRVTKHGDVILLESLASGTGNRWLDGVTAASRVQLAPFSKNTGLRWREVPGPRKEPGVFFLECLGHLPGGKWLDGLTKTGQVRLAPSTDGLSGARWKVSSQFVDSIDLPRVESPTESAVSAESK